MLKLITVIVLSTVLFNSCDKEGYKTYTATDALGDLKGDTDPTDWTNDDEWPNGIDALIAEECVLNGVGNASVINVYPAYPNPTTSTSNLIVATNDTSLLRFVIVDKQGTVYAQACSHLSAGNNFFTFDFTFFAAAIDGRYRLYYDFLNASNTVIYKGHGDVILE